MYYGKRVLRVCTDASLRTFDNGRVFTCSGAVSLASNQERYIVTPDSTNNIGELLGVYLGVKLLEEEFLLNPLKYDHLILYSDSGFCISGLREWMQTWIQTTDYNGIIYGSNGHPVKNQDLFKMIITYCTTHRLVVNFMHQKGHVDYESSEALNQANQFFKRHNGIYLTEMNIRAICYYNNLVDRNSRAILMNINPDDYPRNLHYGENIMVRYIIPPNYTNFIQGG